jgi:hypothetical protein
MADSDRVEELLQSIAKSERHIRSEYGTKMVGVMDTIGDYPHFAMMLQPGQLTILSGRDEIDVMYKGSVDNAWPQASRIVSQWASDWYMFIENVPTRRWVASGEFKTVQTVTMFVTDDANGITGEYAWQRYYPPQPHIEVDGGFVPDRKLRNLQLHEDLLDGVRRADVNVLTAVVEPDCVWAQRDYRVAIDGGEIVHMHGIDAIGAFLKCSCEALKPSHVSILNRHVTDWYIFAEELWVVEPTPGERRQYRSAMTYALNPAGKIEAVLGFGKAMENPAPSADRKLGIAFFPEGVGADTTSRDGFPES